MKLYNRSPIDGKVLKALLAKAARSVGARHGKVLVEIGHGDNLRGTAWNCVWTRIRKRKINCEDSIRIILPTQRLAHLEGMRADAASRGQAISGYWGLFYDDIIELATKVYDLARHEFVHVRDYQHGGAWAMPWSGQGKGGRRPRWAERPEEQRAMAACEDADALGRGHEWAAEEILNLAIALEELGAREGRR